LLFFVDFVSAWRLPRDVDARSLWDEYGDIEIISAQTYFFLPDRRSKAQNATGIVCGALLARVYCVKNRRA